MEITLQHKPKATIPQTSVHTGRTMMFTELSKLMDFSIGTYTDFEHLINENVIAKKTEISRYETKGYLKKLYGFDEKEPSFKVFHYLWQLSATSERPILALLLAITRDYLLSESIDVVINTSIGSRVDTNLIAENIEEKHPNRFTIKTRIASSKNIASTWKQAGHITGKMKNLRTQVTPGYYAVAYALFLGYLQGLRGDFLFQTKWTKALDCSENELRTLAQEAAKRELLSFQYSGNVTVVNFKSLIQKLDLHGIED